MMTSKMNFIKVFRRYCRQTHAAIMVVFALMAPVIVGAAGMGLDFSQAYLVQQRLSQAVDAAALAGAASSSDATVIEQKVKQFFDANYPPEKLGATFDPVVTVNGDEVNVSGSARYNTFFLGVIGIDNIDVEADTTVQREVQGLEVVLVLDNTGSMASNNNIGTLREASENFVNILFDSTNNPSSIRVGMVPYSSSVRIGRYGLGQYLDGSVYGDGYEFVNLPDEMEYTTDYTSSDWYGCVVEHNENGYQSSATHVSGAKGQLWRDSGGNFDGHGWDPRKNTNDPYDYDTFDNYEGPWDPYAYGRIISNGQQCSWYGGYSNSRCSNCTGSSSSCADDYCFCYRADSSGGTNRHCPNAYIKPLSSDREELVDHIGTMTANGFTLGNIGMAWGARLLSPAKPFEEGNPFNDPYWRKAIVVMTDGVNTMEGTYTSYWATAKHKIRGANTQNTRFTETCEALKEKGVTVYTVTFSSGINETTKDVFKGCASNEDQYFDAPTQDELVAVFEQISRELSQLYIKN
jgi:Flp pilus assembly protein TadG